MEPFHPPRTYGADWILDQERRAIIAFSTSLKRIGLMLAKLISAERFAESSLIMAV